MSLSAFTLVLDGMPWLPVIYSNLCSTRLDWQWIVIEGVALPVGCTKNRQSIPERLSNDGTTEFMEWAAKNPRVHYLRQKSWQGKAEMCNTALKFINQPCLLLQIDADEIWRPDHLEKLHMLYEDWPVGGSAKFHCRYFLGPNIVASGINCYGNYDYEWIRAWSYQSSMRFDTHCPPVLDGNRASQMSRDATKRMGLIFDHHAWSTKKQVEFKEQYYGRPGAVEQWEKLQDHFTNPDVVSAPLNQYFQWADDKALAQRLW